MNKDITSCVHALQKELHHLERMQPQPRHPVQIIAVSKGRHVAEVQAAIDAGITHFGENYCQEALLKMDALTQKVLCWHFIGPIQSNKIKRIAARFDWVHSLTNAETAIALNQHRPATARPLNVCIQMNLDNEPSKSGISPTELMPLVNLINTLPRLKLRGLMLIPKPNVDHNARYRVFKQLADWRQDINNNLITSHSPVLLDTLSMGMSADLVEAVQAGATMVRIGRRIFGDRKQ